MSDHQMALLAHVGGDFAYPTVEAPPGLFVEEAAPGETTPRLTRDEFELVLQIWERVKDLRGWHRIGFEAGRAYGHIAFRADVRDGDVMLPETWKLGADPPTSEHRLWAVEFPAPGSTLFRRRTFWYPSRWRVPEGT